MSKTYIHVGKGLFNSRVDKPHSIAAKKYANHCNRYNKDIGESREFRNATREKIAIKDMDIDIDGCDIFNPEV